MTHARAGEIWRARFAAFFPRLAVLSRSGSPIMPHDFGAKILRHSRLCYRDRRLLPPSSICIRRRRCCRSWRSEFHVGAGEIASLMTASTAAIALSAPFTGALADVVGRKRLITAAMFAIVVPTVIMTLRRQRAAARVLALRPGAAGAADLHRRGRLYRRRMAAGRRRRASPAFTLSGASIGGFCGRFIPGILTDVIGWRAAIQVVALFTLDRRDHRRADAARASGSSCAPAAFWLRSRYMLRHLRDRAADRDLCHRLRRAVQLHRHLHLCEFPSRGAALSRFRRRCLAPCSSLIWPPASLVPWVGRGIALFGRRRFVLGTIAAWIVGALLMLAPPVCMILAGLTLCAVCGMLCQTVATGYVTMTAKEGRSSAVGLYASLYYIGGSAGAFLDRPRLDAGRLDRLRRDDRRHAGRSSR